MNIVHFPLWRYKYILLSLLCGFLLSIILMLVLPNIRVFTGTQIDEANLLFNIEDYLSNFMDYSSIPPIKRKWEILLADDRLCDDSANVWKNKLELIFVVRSSDVHFAKRQAIRNTWGNQDHTELLGMRSRTLFVIQLSGLSPLEVVIQNEQAEHGDILLFNAPAQRGNTADKLLETLKFITTRCSALRYVALLNDDILVNHYELIKNLKKVTPGAYPAYSGGMFFQIVSSRPLFLRYITHKGSALSRRIYHLDGTLVLSMPMARLLTIGLQLLQFGNQSESSATAEILFRYDLLPKHLFGLLEQKHIRPKAVFMKIGKNKAAESILQGWKKLQKFFT